MKMNKMWLKTNGITLFIIVALFGSMLWTYSSIKPIEKSTPVQQASIIATPDYEIITTKATILWPAGSKLDQGNASYFYAAGPMLQVSPSVEITGLVSGVISGSIKTNASVQAINDKGVAYWSQKLKSIQDQTFSLSQASAEYKAENISLDVAATNDLATKISQQLKFQTGIYQLVATFEIQIDGIVNGIKQQKSITLSLPIVLQQTSFSLPRATDITASLSLTPVESDKTLLQTASDVIQNNIIQFALDLALVITFIASVFLHKKTRVKAVIEHKKYKEWITEGSVEVKDKQVINIVKLQGLVDLAIDLDKRIIYDSKIKRYFVLEDDIAYVHDPDQANRMLDNKQQLGKLLLDRGLIRPEQLETGLYYQQRLGARLGESLLALGFIDETSLFATLAAQQKVGYYELRAEDENNYSEWADKLNLKKAKALQTLPLGRRADGKMIIACSEPAKEVVRTALTEAFGEEILVVAARPSAIYEAIEKLNAIENSNADVQRTKDQLEPFERLASDEQEQFKAAYYRGSVMQSLLLKAAGFVDPIILTQAPEHEPLSSWLVNRNAISSEVANLLKGFEETIAAISWKERQEKCLPELTQLLQRANYLTQDIVEWAKQEAVVQKLTIAELLVKNHISSAETIRLSQRFIDTLESILNR